MNVTSDLNLGTALVDLIGLGGGFSVAIYFVKKWMKAREDSENKLEIKLDSLEGQHLKSIADVAQIAKDTAASVALVAKDNREENIRITVEIKLGIRDNREEYIRTGAEIKTSIDKLAVHVETTNGRIGAQEIKLAEQATICKLIQEGKREKRIKNP